MKKKPIPKVAIIICDQSELEAMQAECRYYGINYNALFNHKTTPLAVFEYDEDDNLYVDGAELSELSYLITEQKYTLLGTWQTHGKEFLSKI